MLRRQTFFAVLLVLLGACAERIASDDLATGDEEDGSPSAAEIAENVRSYDAGVGRCMASDAAPPERAPQQLGFSSESLRDPSVVEGSEPASVLEVSADNLKLRRGDASVVDFLWRGPSLVEHFSVGDLVQLGRPGFWSEVIGPRTRVMTSRGFSNTSLGREGRVPGGPSYELEPECAGVYAGTCHPLDLIVGTRFALRATLGPDSVTIPHGETQTLGDWQVTNVWHNSTSYVRNGPPEQSGCHIDPYNVAAVTAIGPISLATNP